MSKTVFTNGCFDILHAGHAALFNFCASIGDEIVVGIDSDARVRSMKGETRPVNNSFDRSKVLLCVKKVVRVEVFDSDLSLENLINSVSPDIMVVGSDWKNKRVIGHQFAKKLVFFDRIEEYATTKTIQNIIDR